MRAPSVSADVLPTAVGQAARIVGPSGGSGQAVAPVFCAIGYYDTGVTSITVELFNSTGTSVFSKNATLVGGFNYWSCSVSTAGSGASSSSSSASSVSSASSGSSLPSSSSSTSSTSGTSLQVYRLVITPNTGTGDAKDGIVVNPALANQPCSAFGVSTMEAIVDTAGNTTYLQFPYTYPDPTDPSLPLYEVVEGQWAHLNGAGKIVVYNYPPSYTTGPTKSRIYWLPYYGKGIYFARFTRIEALGQVHVSETQVQLRN